MFLVFLRGFNGFARADKPQLFVSGACVCEQISLLQTLQHESWGHRELDTCCQGFYFVENMVKNGRIFRSSWYLFPPLRFHHQLQGFLHQQPLMWHICISQLLWTAVILKIMFLCNYHSFQHILKEGDFLKHVVHIFAFIQLLSCA